MQELVTNTREKSYVGLFRLQRHQMSPVLTLIVSNGCPAKTRQTPPNPPAKKFFRGLIGLWSLDIFSCCSATRNTNTDPNTHEGLLDGPGNKQSHKKQKASGGTAMYLPECPCSPVTAACWTFHPLLDDEQSLLHSLPRVRPS